MPSGGNFSEPMKRSTPLQRKTPLKRYRSVERECAQCGEAFIAYQEHRTYQRKYCSSQCSADAISAQARAGDPPKDVIEDLYIGQGLSDHRIGEMFGYSRQWTWKLRQRYGIKGRNAGEGNRKPLSQKNDRARWSLALKREDCCRNCGRSDLNLHLHHVIPRSMCRASKYDLRNGVALCTACHLGWHYRRIVIYRDIFTDEEWGYISTVELTGQRIEAWLEERYPERPTDGGVLHVGHCQRGHPFDDENTYITPDGKRKCRACATLRAREYRANAA